MPRNIANTSRVYDQDGLLTEADLQQLTDGNTTSGIGINQGDSIDVVCDFGAPYSLDNITYYRNSAALESIEISGKQNDGTDWMTLQISVSASSVVADQSASENKYRYIRIQHSVISGAAEANEVEVISTDNILFGEIGDKTKYAVETGTAELSPNAISVFNNTSMVRDIFALVDPEYSTDIAVSDNEAGPYVGLYEAGVSVPATFPFSNGYYDNVQDYSTAIVLDPTQVSGTYYTPVIDIGSVAAPRVFWSATTSGLTEIDLYGSNDNKPTIGIRKAHTKPTDIGWSSGQLSADSLWDTTTGSLQFYPLANNVILSEQKERYVQLRIELHSDSPGNTPILHKVGVEDAVKITVPAESSSNIYVRSTNSSYSSGTEGYLICWFYEK